MATSKKATKKAAKSPSVKAVKFSLQNFDPANLTATPINGWAAFINPSTKQGSVRLVMGANRQDLPPMADTTVSAIVTILQSGNCFFDGTNVITQHL
jgi:hypothetical protein